MQRQASRSRILRGQYSARRGEEAADRRRDQSVSGKGKATELRVQESRTAGRRNRAASGGCVLPERVGGGHGSSRHVVTSQQRSSHLGPPAEPRLCADGRDIDVQLLL